MPKFFRLHEHEVDGENPETAYCRSSLRFSSKNHRFPARMPQISCTPRVLPVLQGEKRLSALAPAANHIRVGRKMTFIIQRANHRITTDGETIFFLKLSHQNFHTPHIFSPTKIARGARKIFLKIVDQFGFSGTWASRRVLFGQSGNAISFVSVKPLANRL